RRRERGDDRRVRLQIAARRTRPADQRRPRDRRLRADGPAVAPARRDRPDDPQPPDGRVSTLVEDRRRAIEESGWGEDFRFLQPRNLAFWVYCVLFVAGAFVLSGQISIAAAAYSGAL